MWQANVSVKPTFTTGKMCFLVNALQYSSVHYNTYIGYGSPPFPCRAFPPSFQLHHAFPLFALVYTPKFRFFRPPLIHFSV